MMTLKLWLKTGSAVRYCCISTFAVRRDKTARSVLQMHLTWPDLLLRRIFDLKHVQSGWCLDIKYQPCLY